jgi:anti-sigma B factor antagonist
VAERVAPAAALLPFLRPAATLTARPDNRELPPMTSAASRLRVAEESGVTCIEFVDRNILDEANIQQIGEEINRIIDAEPQPKVLISFDNVDHLSSAALGTLITINNKIRSKDGQLRLANIDKQIYEVFVITKLNKLFQIHETVEQALASFT